MYGLRVPAVVLGLVLSLAALLFSLAPALASPNGVVISELRTRGPAGGNDEFVEGGEEMLRLINGGQRSDGEQFKDGPDGQPINTSDPGFPGASFPYVAANTVYKDSGQTVLPPYKVVKRDGVNVGFIGVTTLETPG